jgi:hypothetical protein
MARSWLMYHLPVISKLILMNPILNGIVEIQEDLVQIFRVNEACKMIADEFFGRISKN